MDAILQSTERSTVAAAAHSDPPAPDGLPEQPHGPVRKFSILRKPVHGEDLSALADCHIEGVDDPAESEAQARPWYLPQTADDADKLIAAQLALSDRLQLIIDDCARQQRACQRRIASVLTNNQDLFETVTPVKPDGKWKDWTGPYTRGNYRNMPGRAPEIVFNDKDKALAGGFIQVEMRPVKVEQTKLIRETDPATLLANGIALIDKPAVSFTPPKVDKGGNSGEAA